ncbi:MAG: O-antigen ligase family protein, partial [Acidimicrobiia bacterium]|nr:O-antigen ligase family protein [Acidimicrobiia bacterium]
DPLSVYGAMVGVGLAARRLGRTEGGRRVLVWMVSASLLLAWFLGAIVWLGAAGTPRWLVVSWHNQSAAFMAAGAVWFGALATGPDRRRASLAAVASGLSLTAVWLTGSRGGLLVAVVGLVLLGVARSAQWRRFIVLAGAAVVGAILFSFSFVDDVSPLEARGEGTAEMNAVARLGHWEAGLGMFLDDPITGWGVGAYSVVAPEFNDAGVNLTSSAHNEFVELFAEGGLLVGGPAILLAAAAALVGLRSLRREATAAELGLGLMVLVLGAHALIDFDWLYPSLAALFAVGVGASAPDAEHRSVARGVGPGVLVMASALLVLLAGSGVWSPMPWSPRPAVEAALEVGPGDPAEGRELLAPALAWNPGDDTAASLDLAYRHLLGEASADELLDEFEVPRTRFGTYAVVGRQLAAGGAVETAARVLDEAIAELPGYVRWGPASVARSIWDVRLQVAYLDEGCDGYRIQVDRLRVDPSFDLYGFDIDPDTGLAAECSGSA